MKNLTLIAGFLLLYSYAYAQKNEPGDFALYKIKFKAIDIVGTPKFSSLNQDNTTKFLDRQPKVTNDLFDILGQYYSVVNMGATKNLLNMYSEVTKQPVIDEINIKFYVDNGIEELRVKKDSIILDPGFQKFVDKIKSQYILGKIDALRDTLYSTFNRKFRLALERARYNIIKNNTFTMSLDQKKQFSVGMAADLVAKIKNNVSLDAKLAAQIEKTVVSNIKIENTKYYEIELLSSYVAQASAVITKYADAPDLLKGKDDIASNALKTFLKSDKIAIITASSVLAIAVDSKKSSDLKTSIGALVSAQGKFNNTQVANVKAEVDAYFESNSGRKFSMTTGVTYYNMRYGYSNDLEKGVGGQ